MKMTRPGKYRLPGGGTITDIMPGRRGAPHHLLVRARVWHPTRSSGRAPVAVLLYTGTGGVNMPPQRFGKQDRRGVAA